MNAGDWNTLDTTPSMSMVGQMIIFIRPFRPFTPVHSGRCSGLMVSTLDFRTSSPGLSPGWGHVLYSSARHFMLTVPLSTKVYKWVPVNLMLLGGGGNPAMD